MMIGAANAAYFERGSYSEIGFHFSQDADEILKMEPSNVRGLVWKAESQYNLANFEHSLKYFYRFVRGNCSRILYNSLISTVKRNSRNPGCIIFEHHTLPQGRTAADPTTKTS